MGDWRQEIARNRGDVWRLNVLKGRIQVQLTPSVLRIRRLKLGIYQSAIAAELGLSESTYGSVEVGKRLVKPHLAELIALAVGTSVGDLFVSMPKSKMRVRFYQ